jgi:agmatinase
MEEADIVIFGVPDESHTHAHRAGTATAPDHIRKISVERGVFERSGKKTVSLPTMNPIEQKVLDAGNILRDQVAAYVEKVLRSGKVPFMIGGDHSITSEALKGFDRIGPKVGGLF